MKKLILLTFLCVITITSQAQTSLVDYLTTAMPKRETRAVWLTTLANLDWPKTYATSPERIEQQKQELIDILDKIPEGKYQHRSLAGTSACGNDLPIRSRTMGQVYYGRRGRRAGW